MIQEAHSWMKHRNMQGFQIFFYFFFYVCCEPLASSAVLLTVRYKLQIKWRCNTRWPLWTVTFYHRSPVLAVMLFFLVLACSGVGVPKMCTDDDYMIPKLFALPFFLCSSGTTTSSRTFHSLPMVSWSSPYL